MAICSLNRSRHGCNATCCRCLCKRTGMCCDRHRRPRPRATAAPSRRAFAFNRPSERPSSSTAAPFDCYCCAARAALSCARPPFGQLHALVLSRCCCCFHFRANATPSACVCSLCSVACGIHCSCASVSCPRQILRPSFALHSSVRPSTHVHLRSPCAMASSNSMKRQLDSDATSYDPNFKRARSSQPQTRVQSRVVVTRSAARL